NTVPARPPGNRRSVPIEAHLLWRDANAPQISHPRRSPRRSVRFALRWRLRVSGLDLNENVSLASAKRCSLALSYQQTQAKQNSDGHAWLRDKGELGHLRDSEVACR